jgi:hypothetical protein
MKIHISYLFLSIVVAATVSYALTAHWIDSKATSAESHVVFNYLNANAATPDLINRFDTANGEAFRSKNKLANILLDSQMQVAARSRN